MTHPIYGNQGAYVDSEPFGSGPGSPFNDGGTPGQGQVPAQASAYPEGAYSNAQDIGNGDGLDLGSGSVQYPSVPVIGDSDDN